MAHYFQRPCNITLPSAMHSVLSALARGQGISLSGLLKRIADEWLAAQKIEWRPDRDGVG